MKYLLVLLSFNLLSYSFAQEKDLIINYSSQLTFEDPSSLAWFKRFRMPQAEIEKMIKNAGKEIHDYILKIDAQQSSFEYQKKINNDQNMGRMRFSFSSGNNWYVDLKDSIRMKEAESMGKDYLIKDSLQKFDWKISRNQKKVFNIDTRKATATLDSIEYTAWYAPSILIPHGPNAITGLPGLIMELEIFQPYEDGKPRNRYWVSGLATKESVKISMPSKGELVTKKEYDEEMEAIMERFKEMRGNRIDRD